MPRPKGGKITDRLLKMFGEKSDGWDPPRTRQDHTRQRGRDPEPPAAGYKLGRGGRRKKED